MKLTPRKEEVAHVAKAINKDFDTAEAAAKAAIKATAEALEYRDALWVCAQASAPAAMFGPFSSEIEATKAAGTLQASVGGDDWRAWRIFPMGKIAAQAREAQLQDDCECKHSKFDHLSSGRCAIYDHNGKPCGCEKYVNGNYPIPQHPTCITCQQPLP